MLPEKVKIKFMASSNIPDDKTMCWEWKKGKTGRGYGAFYPAIKGFQKQIMAHRISYSIFKNNNVLVDKNICICHTCDNPSCVNPDHLFAGSNQDNVNDKVSKRKQARGEMCNKRLTADIVIKIRNEFVPWKVTKKYLAKKYNVSFGTISDLVQNKTWRHIL